MSEEIEYSFFVAGHIYGKPGAKEKGIYPPFVKKFSLINSYEKQSFGVLTGDIVRTSSKEEWDEVDNDLKLLDNNIHFALGNHDYINLSLIKERFNKTYYSFNINNDLHIILDPNIDKWNISGKQLEFLKDLLINQSKKVENIFVYFHQILWWSPTNRYAKIRLNSHQNRDPDLNFWTEVAPLFHELNNQIYMFGGDVGATSVSEDYSYHTDKNIHLISSGMGEGKGDNFLIVEVYENKGVRINLIPINEGESRVLEQN
jgi:hypothetical protein